jgi:2-hydroxychromene-2-carboxylate isomerase
VLTAVDGSIPFSSTKKITDEIFFGKDRLRDVEEMIMQSK